MTNQLLLGDRALSARSNTDPEPASEATRLLRDLAHCGVTLRADGPTLYARAPHGLSEEHRTQIAQHKPALLALLRGYRCTRQQQCTGATRFAAPTVCFWCRESMAIPPIRGAHDTDHFPPAERD